MSDRADERHRKILDAALALAVSRGWPKFTRRDVADLAGVATGNINHAFGTMDALRDAVVAAAIDAKVLTVVGQALAAGHPAAKAAPPDVRTAALASLAA